MLETLFVLGGMTALFVGCYLCQFKKWPDPEEYAPTLEDQIELLTDQIEAGLCDVNLRRQQRDALIQFCAKERQRLMTINFQNVTGDMRQDTQ